MNIIIYLCILIVSMIFLYFSNKFLKKDGLIITFISMSIISLILNFKYISLSTINANSNCISHITMLMSIYLLLETCSKKETKEAINLNFIINIFTAVMMYLMTYYKQSLTDTISVNMNNVFFDNYKILIVYPITILMSNYLFIWLYEKINNIYDNHFIKIVTSYLFVGIIEGIIYTLLVYNGILNIKTIIMIILSTYMIQIITAIIYSLFLTVFFKKKVKS